MTAATGSRKATVTLPTDEQILISRTFAAPKHLVFRAWTTPQLVRRWWPAGQGEATTVEIDLRVGGRWRYELRGPGEDTVAFHGEYREIVPDERIVSTEVNDDAPEVVALRTVTFTEVAGGTELRISISLDSKEHRDLYLSWMGDGLQDAIALFERTVLSLLDADRS
jgi:uncharacterized protein YndB with AHSA1/START domain